MAKTYPAPEATDPQFISDFKGVPKDVLKQKADYISKFGFNAYEQLVMRSGKQTVR